jgi:acetoin utilization deacetylase AcuC-like enzyme
LILDWDVHHGNGTQDIFYDDPSVVFASIHRYGAGFYPGTGSAEETGTGAGLGSTINLPLRAGTGMPTFRERIREALDRACGLGPIDLILVSAGYDAHRLDPIGGLTLESGDYAQLTRDVLDVASARCGGRAVFCMEGGYHWQATAESVRATIATLLGDAA